MAKRTTKSAAETKAFVRELASQLCGGDVLALVGPLGAGKTTAVQVLAAALGVEQRPRSPSYTLLQPYQLPREVRGIRTLVHVDAYRVSGSELLEAGLADYLADPGALVAVEWGDRVRAMLPPHTRWVHITPGAEPGTRHLASSGRTRSARRASPRPAPRSRVVRTAAGKPLRRRG